MQPIPNPNNISLNFQGIFWGKSLQNLGQWQYTVDEIDRWILLQDKIGIISDEVYFLFIDRPFKYTVCLRRLWGPTNRIKELLQNNVDGWEAYVVNMDEGQIQGELKSFPWMWSKSIELRWHNSSLLKFAKL